MSGAVATCAASCSTCASIVALVQEAQSSKAPGQRLADRAGFWLVLRPEIAALSMSGSSFLVAANAVLLKRLRLPWAVEPPAPSGDRRPEALTGVDA